MPRDTIAAQGTDADGRLWTIVSVRAVVGFRWTVYLHVTPLRPDTLDEFLPGGVAYGWTDDDHEFDAVKSLLAAIANCKGHPLTRDPEILT